MLKYIFVIFFLILPIVALYSQDKPKDIITKTEQKLKSDSEVICHDCQGWGWILINKISSGPHSVSFSGSSNSRGNMNNRGVIGMDMEQGKMICPYCGGKGKIHIE